MSGLVNGKFCDLRIRRWTHFQFQVDTSLNPYNFFYSQVNVFVNGNLVPFQMKIGDAGEAFFIFETDEDVPEDLVTSPLLEATKPGDSNAQVRTPPTGRFGAKEHPVNQEPSQPSPDSSQEPDFLDLNAAASSSRASLASSTSTPSKPSGLSLSKPSPSSLSPEHDRQDDDSSSLLTRAADIGNAVLGAAHEVSKSEKDKLKDKSLKAVIAEADEDESNFFKDSFQAARSVSASDFVPFGKDKGDDVLPEVPEDAPNPPEVVYTHGKLVC